LVFETSLESGLLGNTQRRMELIFEQREREESISIDIKKLFLKRSFFLSQSNILFDTLRQLYKKTELLHTRVITRKKSLISGRLLSFYGQETPLI